MATKMQRGSFPFPVLDHTDEVDALFEIIGNPQIEPGSEKVRISLELHLSEEIRQDLINTGKLLLVANWNCTATLQSGLLHLDTDQSFTDNTIVHISIPLSQIVDKVKVSVMLVAGQHMPDFRWPAQNKDYGDAHFAISKGDQVGFAGEFSFVAHRWFDPMIPPLDSCIQFVQLTEPGGPFTVNLADDVIKVALPNETYQSFVLQENRPLLQQTLFVVPALMYALDEMSRDDGEHSDKAWFRSLSHILEARGIDEYEDSLIAVQKLLDYPATALLSEIEDSQEDLDE